MAVWFGSARSDSRKKLSGDIPGDQRQTELVDTKGEVSMEKFYVHKKGWIVFRPKNDGIAIAIAANMVTACNNIMVGYDQSNRLDIITKGVNTRVFAECDCSSLIRQCIREASGIDPGNFNTSNEPAALERTGLFNKIEYVPGMTMYTGDVLVTKTKGHTGAITSGAARNFSQVIKGYYPVYAGNTNSIVTALQAVGETNTSFSNRGAIARANDIVAYEGTAFQNLTMLNLLKLGKLKKVR